MNFLVAKSYIPGRFYGYSCGEECLLADGSTWRIIQDVWVQRKVRKDVRASVFRQGERHFLMVKGMPYEVEVEPVDLPRFVLETPTEFRSSGILGDQLAIPEMVDDALEKWRAFRANPMDQNDYSSHGA